MQHRIHSGKPYGRKHSGKPDTKARKRIQNCRRRKNVSAMGFFMGLIRPKSMTKEEYQVEKKKLQKKTAFPSQSDVSGNVCRWFLRSRLGCRRKRRRDRTSYAGHGSRGCEVVSDSAPNDVEKSPSLSVEILGKISKSRTYGNL